MEASIYYLLLGSIGLSMVAYQLDIIIEELIFKIYFKVFAAK